jgi:hypothetical protein
MFTAITVRMQPHPGRPPYRPMDEDEDEDAARILAALGPAIIPYVTALRLEPSSEYATTARWPMPPPYRRCKVTLDVKVDEDPAMVLVELSPSAPAAVFEQVIASNPDAGPAELAQRLTDTLFEWLAGYHPNSTET